MLKQSSRKKVPKFVVQDMHQARTSLSGFCWYTTDGVWQEYAHSKIINEHLEALERREITRLMILAPPRFGKSEAVSRHFPVWYLGRHPNHQFLLTSYSGELATDLARIAKNSMEEYGEELFGLKVARESRAVRRWALENRRGSMAAVGIGGVLSGRGGDVLDIDDPIKNWAQARSMVYQQSCWDEYRSTLRLRLQPGGAIVLCMTRWHPNDLAGKLLEQMEHGGEYAAEWTVLKLKAIAEEGDDDDPLGRKPGEVLCPEMFSEHEVLQTREEVMEYAFTAHFQQDPRPDLEGALWSQPVIDATREGMPDNLERCVVAVDTAKSRKTTASETGIIVGGARGAWPATHGYVLADYSGHYSPEGWAQRALDALEFFNADYILAEVDTGGEMVESTIRTIAPDAPIKLIRAKASGGGGKKMRAYPVSALYPRCRMHHVGVHGKLEMQMCNWDGSGRSPDRIDALVHFAHDLVLRKRKPKKQSRVVGMMGVR